MVYKLSDVKASSRWSLLGAALLLGAWTDAAMANPTSCTQGNLTRTVEIVYAEPGQAVPCEVIYAKPAASTIEMLWQAMNQAGYCEQQAAGFIEKLEGYGWHCSSQDAETDNDSKTEADSAN